jgi:hypothetical protein
MKDFPAWFSGIGQAQLIRVDVAEDHDVTGKDPCVCEFCEDTVHIHDDGSGIEETTAVMLLVRHDGTHDWAEPEHGPGLWMICCQSCLWDAQVMQREHAKAEALQLLSEAREVLVRCGAVAPNDSRWLQRAGAAVDTARLAIRDIALEATVDEQLEAS